MNETSKQGFTRRRALQFASVVAATPVLSGIASAVPASAQDDNPFGEATTTGGSYTVAGVGVGSARVFVPTSYYGTTAFYHCKLLFTPLIFLDSSWVEFGPALATEWEWSENGEQLTVKLREGVTFHDGEAFTADDVVFSYKFMTRVDTAPAVQDLSILEGALAYKAGESEDLPGVVAVDDHTVQFNLTATSSAFLLNISNHGILPEHAFEDDTLTVGKLVDDIPFFAEGKAIGTGPWAISSYDPEVSIQLVAFENYFKGRPVLDQLNMLYGISGPAGISGLQANEFDAYYVGGAFQDIQVLEGTGQFTMELDYKLANETVLIVATEKDYMSVPVRQALLTAIDMEAVIGSIAYGYALPAPSVMMHASLFPNPTLPEYSYDPEKAVQLLTDAGYDFDRVLKFAQVTTTGQPTPFVAVLMDFWSQIGVKTEYMAIDSANLAAAQAVENHEYDMSIQDYAWLAYNPSSTYSNFACERRPNHANYCNETYDEAIQLAIRATDPAEATALFQEAQTILQTELPYIPLWIQPAAWAISPLMHGGDLGRGPLNDIQSELWWKD